jgi:hypothetical protein
MIIDALFLNRAFQNILRGVLMTTMICIAYIIWSEAIVGPFNIEPIGSVTSGLPYPFLNDMVFMERALFYATTTATGVMMYAGFWLFSKLLPRLISQKNL